MRSGSAKLTEALLEPEFAQSVRTAGATYQAERNGHPLSFIAFKQVPWHHYARLAVEQSQLTLRSPYLDNDLVALIYRAPSELFSSKEPSLRLIHEGNPLLARFRRIAVWFIVRLRFSGRFASSARNSP